MKRNIVIGSVLVVLVIGGVIFYSIHQKHRLQADVAFLKAQEQAEVDDVGGRLVKSWGKAMDAKTAEINAGYLPTHEEASLDRIEDQNNWNSMNRIIDGIHKKWQEKIAARKAGEDVDMSPYVPSH